jgi:acyl carrier protein
MTPTLSEPSLFAEVVDVIRKAVKVPARIAIHADSRLVDDLAIDSLDLVGLILQIQDHFDVVIEEDDVPNLCRVADLAALISGQWSVVSGQPGGRPDRSPLTSRT